MVAHLSWIVLVVSQNLAIRVDERDAKSGSISILLDPGLQCRPLLFHPEEVLGENYRTGLETVALMAHMITLNPSSHDNVHNQQHCQE